jgi:hypothetical protein
MASVFLLIGQYNRMLLSPVSDEWDLMSPHKGACVSYLYGISRSKLHKVRLHSLHILSLLIGKIRREGRDVTGMDETENAYESLVEESYEKIDE